MQSLFNNIIKNTSVVDNGIEEVKTSYVPKLHETKDVEEKKDTFKEDINRIYQLKQSMIQEASNKSKVILKEALDEAKKLKEEFSKKGQEEGHKLGYEKGYEEGKEKGYIDAYEKNINKGMEKYESMIKQGEELLKTCHEYHNEYLKNSEEEIRELMVHAIENILKTEVKNKEAMNNIIFETLQKSKKCKSFIVKCNDNYYQEVKEKCNEYKINIPYKGELIVIKDNLLEDGIVLMETEQGMIKSDINVALEKLKQILVYEK